MITALLCAAFFVAGIGIGLSIGIFYMSRQHDEQRKLERAIEKSKNYRPNTKLY